MKRKSRIKKDKKTNKPINVFFVYIMYFCVFVALIQIFERDSVKLFFEENLQMSFRFDSIGLYAPLFLSALLIDVTYRLGKRQNELVARQTRESEYNSNKTIYVSISKVTDYVRFFVQDCRFALLRASGQEDLIKEYNLYNEMFESCSIDCDLRFPELTNYLRSYRLALMRISTIKLVLYQAQMDNQIDCRNMIYSTDINGVDEILSCVQDNDMKLALKQHFEQLQIYQERVERDSQEILNAIKQKMQQ